MRHASEQASGQALSRRGKAVAFGELPIGKFPTATCVGRIPYSIYTTTDFFRLAGRWVATKSGLLAYHSRSELR